MQQMIDKAAPYLVLDYPDSIEAHSTKWADLPLVAGGVLDVAVDHPVRITVHLAAEPADEPIVSR